MAITRRQNEQESLSNPLKTREVMSFATKKSNLILDFGFSVDVYISGGCSCKVLYTSMASSSYPLDPQRHFFKL